MSNMVFFRSCQKIRTKWAQSMLRQASSNSSVDDSQLKLFNQLGGQWWHDPTLLSLKNLNDCRVRLFRDFLLPGHGDREFENTAIPLKGIKLLDVGCGGGFLSESMAKLGATTTGLDVAEDALQAAREHMTLDPKLAQYLTYESATVEDFSVAHQGQFDVVVLSEVIEHVNEQSDFVGNCVRCARPGGSVIVTTMSKNPVGAFSNIFLCESICGTIPEGAHQYSKFNYPGTIKKWLLNHRCSTVDVKGFMVNFYNADVFRVPFTWFNFAIHAVKHQ